MNLRNELDRAGYPNNEDVKHVEPVEPVPEPVKCLHKPATETILVAAANAEARRVLGVFALVGPLRVLSVVVLVVEDEVVEADDQHLSRELDLEEHQQHFGQRVEAPVPLSAAKRVASDELFRSLVTVIRSLHRRAANVLLHCFHLEQVAGNAVPVSVRASGKPSTSSYISAIGLCP